MDAAREFFNRRAGEIGPQPTLTELCWVSGRDPRLWSDAALLDDLADSIINQTASGRDSTLLEVGCAAGFIARIVAPRVGRYVGVDISDEVIHAARRLDLPNAEFRPVPSDSLPFDDATFDTAICYDVITNFPDVSDITPVVAEMLRVVKPGGRVMVGSVPDSATQDQYVARAGEVGRDLEARFGPRPPQPATPAEASVVGYYFPRDGFLAMGRQLGAAVDLRDIQPLSPYVGFRFNAVFTKPR